MMADMMGKGTKYRNAQELAQTLDGVGASIGSSSAGQAYSINGSCLKKHAKLLFSILGEQLTVPTFDNGEIEKLREQYLASVASERGSSMQTAQAMARKVIYGMDSPVAQRQSEESIKSVTRDDIQAAFKKYIIPNNAAIAVVGDVTVDEVKKLLKEHLGGWKKGEKPETGLKESNPEPAGVYFVARPGAVQSAVLVVAPVPGIENEEWLNVDLTSRYFGSSFGSILFSTLRETYSYTYSPFGFTTSGPRFNRFTTGAEVRSSVTDSAINVILSELNRLRNEGPEPERLERRISQAVGSYRLLFEQSSTIGNLLLGRWFSNVPLEHVTQKDKRIEQIAFGDVKRVAEKYLDPFKLRIVVVGNADVRGKLDNFGKVHDFDVDLKPVVISEYEKVDMGLDEIIEGYANAIGGQSAIGNIKTVAFDGKATMTMQGRTMPGTVTRKLMVPNMEVSKIDLGVMKQTQWVDGSNAWVSMNGGPANSPGPDEKNQMVGEARTFQVLYWAEDGYTLKEAGKRGDKLEVQVQTPFGGSEKYVFNANTMLLEQVEKEQEGPRGPMVTITKYMGYKDVSGVKFPHKVATQNSMFSLEYTWDVVVNSGVAESDFNPNN